MSRRWLLVLVAAVAALAASPAGAKVVFHEHYSFTESFTDAPCGFPLDVVFTVEGQIRIRESKGGEAFYGRDTASFRAVFTNPENGRWFVIRGHGVVNEVKATQVEDTIYEFDVVEAGQSFLIEDSEGNVIVRDRGLLRHTILFDTLGDGEPGGELISEETEVHGPHPGFDEDFPFCEHVTALAGP
jgi:hypothetical protein